MIALPACNKQNAFVAPPPPKVIVLQFKKKHAAEGRPQHDYHDVTVEIGLMTDKDYPYHGHVDYVSPQVNPATGTLEVRAIFENKDDFLLTGLFVRVRVPVQRAENALWVDESAIGQNQLGEYLLVLGKENVVEQRRIETGETEGGLKVVRSGVKSDDRGDKRSPARRAGAEGKPGAGRHDDDGGGGAMRASPVSSPEVRSQGGPLILLGVRSGLPPAARRTAAQNVARK